MIANIYSARWKGNYAKKFKNRNSACVCVVYTLFIVCNTYHMAIPRHIHTIRTATIRTHTRHCAHNSNRSSLNIFCPEFIQWLTKIFVEKKRVFHLSIECTPFRDCYVVAFVLNIIDWWTTFSHIIHMWIFVLATFFRIGNVFHLMHVIFQCVR